eukprot:gene22780-biopygen23547
MAHRSSVEPSSECQQFRPLLISQAHEQSDDQVIYRKLRTVRDVESSSVPSFGAEVESSTAAGVLLQGWCEGNHDAVAEVRRALAVYGVIGFRRSPEGRLLGPDDLVRLAGFLGCIQSTPQSSLEPPGSSPSTAVLRVVREAGQTGEFERQGAERMRLGPTGRGTVKSTVG